MKQPAKDFLYGWLVVRWSYGAREERSEERPRVRLFIVTCWLDISGVLDGGASELSGAKSYVGRDDDD